MQLREQQEEHLIAQKTISVRKSLYTDHKVAKDQTWTVARISMATRFMTKGKRDGTLTATKR